MLGILSVKQLMPELCRFDGFGVYIYPGDHDPPHFHGRRADFRVKVDNLTINVTRWPLSSSVEKRLFAWFAEIKADLINAWDRIKAGLVPNRIMPPWSGRLNKSRTS